MDFGRPNTQPNQLPTPPETDIDYRLLAGIHPTMDLMNAPGVADADMNSHPSAGAFRRVSTLAYHSSSSRDLRERTTSRQTRWLIVVIPPAWLAQEHGPLGHTLASGPTQRLAQGVLMPLLPTMYGQLTAIAREFNFPSPVGLCIYLRIIEQGITLTPRVSDEAWPALWGHLFEARSPSTQQSPVCGHIEFDIEQRKARWLDSWLASNRRQVADVLVSVPSSHSHWRGESKTSFDEKADERSEVLPAAPNRRSNRHVPKKLSLVDKLETLSVTSSMANAIPGNSVVTELPISLATILQEDESKMAMRALEQRVHSWRASSSVAPTPMATAGQIDFNTVHIPNGVQLDNVDDLTEVEDTEPLDLNDFAWTVSSLGPRDHDSLASAFSSHRGSSVHLDRRVGGSVLLTPTTATSWGPESPDFSPVPTLFRLPSPDIGRRVTEDCPLTPSTVTSWGPEDLLYSPASFALRLPSPDLGRRMLEDCPPTPSTVASWGPEELSSSPTSMVFRLPSPDPGLRTLGHLPSLLPARGSLAGDDGSSRTSSILTDNHVFPYFVASDCPAWTLIWPFYGRSSASCTAPVEDFRGARILTGSCVFPYFIASGRSAWPLTWPFYSVETVSSVFSSRLPKLYPTMEIYDVVYPHFELYPGHIFAAQEATVPDAVDSLAQRTTSASLFPLNATEYTSNSSSDMCRGHLGVVQSLVKVDSVHLGHSYPTLSIYPLVYPYLCIYPSQPADLVVSQGVKSPLAQNSLSCSERGAFYPSFNLYPASYLSDFMCIYPPTVLSGLTSSLPISHAVRSPCPSANKVDQIIDNVSGTRVTDSSRVESVHLSGSKCLVSSDPCLTGCSPSDSLGYPHFDIYPAVVGHDPLHLSSSDFTEMEGNNLRLLEIYPRTPLCQRLDYTMYETTNSKTLIGTAVYPKFELYPPVSLDETDGLMATALLSLYPRMRIYPIVYPCFEIYPGHISNGENGGVVCYNKSSPQPLISYPYFDIYRSGLSEDQLMLPSLQCRALNLYIPVSRHVDILPSAVQELAVPKTSQGFISRKARKTHRDLQEEVGTPAKESVQQDIARPHLRPHVRGHIHSETVSAYLAPRQNLSSADSLPPVPPLPAAHVTTHRTTASDAEARTVDSPIATRDLAVRPVSSHIALSLQSSSIDDEGLVVPSNTVSRQRRDHTHHKQSHRPRDSLVLEKARLFDHLHALSHDEHPFSTSGSILSKSAHLLASPVSQLSSGITRPQKADHSSLSLHDS